MSEDAPAKRRHGVDALGSANVRALIEENVRIEHTLRDLKLGIDSHSIVAFTDRNGIILDVNDKFVEVSKYTREELIGAPQSIVNSGRHPKSYFADMWRTITKRQIWQGTICNRAKDGSEYWVATTIVPLLNAEGEIERYLSIRTDVTQLFAAEERVRRLAYNDQLTGLANRSQMLSYLNESAQAPGDDTRVYITVEFVGMPMVNETFGFAAGDDLLRNIGEYFLKRVGAVAEGTDSQTGAASETDLDALPLLRRPKIIARIGTSVFAAVFEGLTETPENAETVAEGLAAQLGSIVGELVREEFGKGIEPEIRASYIVFCSNGACDGAEVFSQGEIARRHSSPSLYGGEASVATFEQIMVDEARARITLAFDLRKGLTEGHFQLYLQPFVGPDREIKGFEGLVRWVDPVRGMLLPGEFIPLAERTGIIVEIGDWVLNEASRMLAEWARHPETRHYTLSVNVSERQLRQDVLVESVRSALRAHGAPAERLRLEVTETELHRDIDRSVEILRELQAERIHISLDDFGTGYASLNHLNRLPVHSLKIDRSFVTSIATDAREAALVGTIVQLARLMGLSVCAEGVETEEQFQTLKAFGIDSYQGYLFGRPEPRTEWGV